MNSSYRLNKVYAIANGPQESQYTSVVHPYVRLKLAILNVICNHSFPLKTCKNFSELPHYRDDHTIFRFMYVSLNIFINMHM